MKTQETKSETKKNRELCRIFIWCNNNYFYIYCSLGYKYEQQTLNLFVNNLITFFALFWSCDLLRLHGNFFLSSATFFAWINPTFKMRKFVQCQKTNSETRFSIRLKRIASSFIATKKTAASYQQIHHDGKRDPRAGFNDEIRSFLISFLVLLWRWDFIPHVTTF